MKECCEIERQKSAVRFIQSDFRREIRYETESAKEVYVLVVADHFCFGMIVAFHLVPFIPANYGVIAVFVGYGLLFAGNLLKGF